MKAKEWLELNERIQNHNKQFDAQIEVTDFLSMEVIEIPANGVVVCKNKKGLLQVLMGDYSQYKVGDTIGMELTGETLGEGIGMKLISK